MGMFGPDSPWATGERIREGSTISPAAPEVVAAFDFAARNFGHLVPDRPVLNAARAGYPFVALRGMTGLGGVTASVDFDCVKREAA